MAETIVKHVKIGCSFIAICFPKIPKYSLVE